MRYKFTFTMFVTVLASLFICNFANAAVRFDPDVGIGKSIVKAGGSFDKDHTYQLSTAAYEPAPAFARHEYVGIIYKQPKSNNHLMIWNARINHNFPFQIPGRASPSLYKYPLLE